MRDTMTASTDQWMQQFYDQQPPLEKVDPMHEAPARWDQGRVDVDNLTPASGETTNPTTLTMASETTILSSTNSYTSNIGQLTPKGNVSKPIRRRSRASKRTPTTLLNANTTNFRALVQQFTGCPSTTLSSSSSTSLGVHKGPITLNFQQGSKHVHHDHHHTTRVTPQFSSTSYNQVHQVPAPFPWKKEPDQLLQQQQQNGYSFDHYVKSSSNNFVPNSGNSSSRPSSTSNMDVSDGLLLVDNDFSLHDLAVNAFSNDGFQE